ncbi:MAG: hypothetical protein GY765_28640, partial [bacterium]|nr:hypothetical protein [bacterium]
MNYRTVLSLLLLAALMMGSCSFQKEFITPYKAPSVKDEIKRLTTEGDLNFDQLHLHGWLKADEYYEQAYQLKPTDELKKKRYLTLSMIALRQKDERIPDTETYQKIARLGEFPKTGKLKYLAPILKHYHSTPILGKYSKKPRAKEKQEIDISLFDLRESDLDAYLYLYFLNYYTFDLSGNTNDKADFFKQHNLQTVIKTHNAALSPLFIYWDKKKFAHREDEIEEQMPEFCEFLIAKGNSLFKSKHLKQAAVYYRKTLKLVSNYTTAANGLGSIYYFTVRDYETAMAYYDHTLVSDPLNATALFGKAVSLHYLERYDESNVVLDFMLENQSVHHGEAYYYKAYNKKQRDDPAKARTLVDKAKLLMPQMGEVLFLSGMLHFSAGNMEEAEKDFVKTLHDQNFAGCYPLYYLGMINLKAGNWLFYRDFKEAIQCFTDREGKMEKRVAEVDTLHLGEKEKEWMRTDRREK